MADTFLNLYDFVIPNYNTFSALITVIPTVETVGHNYDELPL